MLIATAGHIDHGKTALVRALTGVETDRLPEEKARGISIDLGFAYWQPDEGPTVGFVDVPGHERYVRNMMAGLSGIGFALLVVAADDGVMPQTIEHLRILDLLQIRRGIVALTKADRVPPERIDTVRGEVAELLAPTGLAGAPILTASSLTGTGIPALAAALLAAREELAVDHAHLFRLAIDRVFSVAGSGTVVTGTVIAGNAALGDNLVVSPLGREVRLRGMQSGGNAVGHIGPGQRCAFNLAGIEVGEVHRGDWLVAPAAHAPSSRIEARVTMLADRPAPLRHDSGLHLHIGTAAIAARLLVPGQRSLQPGSENVVRIVPDRPVLAVSGDRFVLRDASGRELLGGGTVLDPLASPRRQPLSGRELRAAALSLPTPNEKLAALAEIPGLEPHTGWFARICNLTPEALDAVLDKGRFVLAGKQRNLAIAPARFARLSDRLVEAVGRHHREHPVEGGLPRRAARNLVGEPVSVELLATVLRELSAAGRIEAEGALLRLPGHAAAFSPAEIALWRKVIDACEDDTPRTIVATQLSDELHTSMVAVTAMLARRKISGDVWQVTETRYMLRDHVARLAALAAGLDAECEAGFTAASFRDASGMGRNFVIQLLEFFDRIGVTRRLGNNRRMRADWETVVGPAMH